MIDVKQKGQRKVNWAPCKSKPLEHTLQPKRNALTNWAI